MKYVRILIAVSIIWASLAALIATDPVLALEGPSMPIKVGIVVDEAIMEYSTTGAVYASVKKLLDANRIPSEALDVSAGQHYTFLDGSGNPLYSTILINAPGTVVDATNSKAILQVVRKGAGAVALQPDCVNSTLAPLFGILTVGSRSSTANGLKIASDEFTFAYKNVTFKAPGMSLRNHTVNPWFLGAPTIVARDTTQNRPCIWTYTYKYLSVSSRTVFFNNNLMGSFYLQGILLQGILYSMPVGLSSPTMAGVIDVDDCERTYYDSYNVQAYHYDYVTNFIRFLDAYNLDASTYVSFSYSDAGNTDGFWAHPESLNGVYRFLRAGHEVGWHCGQAHYPLDTASAPWGWGSESAMAGEVDALKAATQLLRQRLQSQYGVALPEVVSYVAPMEVMGPYGYQLLDTETGIKNVGVHYVEDYSPEATCRDFGIEPGTDIYNLPRAQGDFYYFTKPETDQGYYSWATLRCMIESGQPYVIFTHPDEQNLIDGYSPTMSQVFGGYTTWANYVAKSYPFYRWTTAGELGQQLRSRSGYLDARWYPQVKTLQIANAGQNESLQVKTPLYLRTCSRSGGTLNLTFSTTSASWQAPGYDIVKTGKNYSIFPAGAAQTLPVVPATPFQFQAPVPRNQAPVLKPIGNRSTAVGESLSFSVTAGDPDGDALIYSAAGLPAGASFDDRTHTFSWAPGSPGVYVAHFEVTDGMTRDVEDISITVEPLALGAEEVITWSVSSSADDGFSGTWAYSNADWWYQIGNPGAPYDAWFRFTGVPLPDAVVVTEAYLELQQTEWDNGTQLKVFAEKAQSPTAPASTADHASRVRTFAGAEWSSGYSDSWYHTTPDISQAIQELVNTYSYGGNATIQILVDDNQGTSGAQLIGGTFDGGVSPRLVVKYRRILTPPTVVTTAATGITTTSASLNANLISLGKADSATVYFEWGLAPGTYDSSTMSQALNGTGAVGLALSGLSAQTTYYYRVVAAGDGTAYGGEMSFTTEPPSSGVSWGSHDTPATMQAGESYLVPVNMTNTSSLTWVSAGDNPVRLAYHWYTSDGVLVTWDGNRTALPYDVATGGSVTADATVIAPSEPGSYVLKWDMVQEGVTWFGWNGSPTLDVKVEVQSSPYGAKLVSDDNPETMSAGESYVVSVGVTNTGTLTWLSAGDNPVRLAYHWYTSDGVLVTWDGNRTALTSGVGPGESVTLGATVIAPSEPGSYVLKWDMVQEGITWFGWKGSPTLDVTVQVA